jgi:hypothetical protein
MPDGYTIDHRAVAQLLYGKGRYPDMDPIYHDLHRRAESVQRRAKVLVGKDTGRLAARITLKHWTAPPYIWFRVEGETRYAYLHHQGTKPHIIVGSLEFRKGGRMIHTREVHHPGTKPNPYLRNALPAFMGARDAAHLR